MADLETFLRRSPATNEQRAALWDAFEQSANEDELASRLETISVPKSLKAQLWDLKASPVTESAPDPRGIGASGGMAMRAGAQVLAPKNPKAILNVAVDAGRFAGEIPGAIASVYGDIGVGALKGLGGMANTAMGAVGIPMPEYSETAFDPSNPVQSGGKLLTQEGVIAAATAPLAGPVVRVAGKVLKPLTSRLVPLAKAVAEFSGVGERARKAKKVWDAARGGTARKAESEAASKIKREAAEDAEKILEAKQAKAVEDKVLRRELSDAKKMDKVDRGRQAKAEFEARKASKEAPKAPESPQDATSASSKGSEPQIFDSRTGKPVELSPEEARKAVANQPWNRGKPDVVEAKPAFPGQQSAKGATKARFASNLDRNVVKWAESGNKPETIQKKVKSIFKRDLSLDEIDSILIRAKETN